MTSEKKAYSTRQSAGSTPSKPSKPLHSTTTPKSKGPTNPFATQTPDQQPVRRLRNRNVALSLTEIKRAATASRPPHQPKADDRSAKSARRRIDSWPDVPSSATPTRKQGCSGGREPAKLPEKYEMLIEFFNCLDSAVRLLTIKCMPSTFPNIFRIIESLTTRRFSHGNLAQLKYILPEAIEIEKVMKFDEATSCMKPDLHVSISPDAVEFEERVKSSEEKRMMLRKLFRKRLVEFSESHPEGDEVPEEMLPEPFNSSKCDKVSEQPRFPHESVDLLNSAAPLSTENEALQKLQPAVASHHPRSFRKSFSKKGRMEGMIVDNASAPPSRLSSDGGTGCLSSVSAKPVVAKRLSSASASLADTHVACIPQSPIKVKDGGSALQSTPAKVVLSPVKLMSVTPAQRTQKRSLSVSHDGDDAVSLPNKLVRRLPVDDDDDLSESLLESIREKQRKAEEERDPAISQAKRRRKMLASSPKLFDTVQFLFQSIRRSVITKDELVHKIIAGQSDIVDRREVEERLNLLEELLPEWISEKRALSGDLLCCINKNASAEAMRERLKEAI